MADDASIIAPDPEALGGVAPDGGTIDAPLEARFSADQKTASRLNIVLKISERCNLKCSYCYFFFAGDETWKKHPAVIGKPTVDAVARFARQAARHYGIKRVRIVFHGGEPLLLKKSRFVDICEVFRRHEDGFEFQFGIQTNGALVDDEWIDIFEAHRIAAGVSLDGPAEINDKYRIDKRDRSSYADTIRGYELLRAAADAGRLSPPGLLAVIDPEADGAAIYRHFAHDLGCTYMNFLTPDWTHDAVLEPGTVEKVNAYLLAVVKEWFRDARPHVRVRAFSEVVAAMAGHVAHEESVAWREDYRNIITVSSDGGLGPEDTIRTVDPRFAEMGLNVRGHTLADLFDSDVWREQERAALIRPEACAGCGWWSVCKGGKPINRYSAARGFDNPTLYCSGLKDIYAEVAAYLVRAGIPLSEITERLGRNAT